MSPRAVPNFTREEDQVICRSVSQHHSQISIAKVLGRSERSIRSRICRLRATGQLGAFVPRRDVMVTDPVALTPPIVLLSDDKLVSRTVAEGGFPRAVQLGERTFWVDADGNQWAHKPKGKSALSTTRANLSPAEAFAARDQPQRPA